MSPPGRPKGEYRSAKHEGTPVSPPGRPKGEYRSAKHEGTPVSPPGRPKGDYRSAKHEGTPANPSRRRLGIALLAASWAGVARGAIGAAEAARIERLLAYVEAQKQARFIRNGTAYSSADAVRFLRAKYAKIGEHVTTAAQFIEQVATRSSTSGQPYLIRLPDGRTISSAQFLSAELERIDRQQP